LTRGSTELASVLRQVRCWGRFGAERWPLPGQHESRARRRRLFPALLIPPLVRMPAERV